MRTRIAVRFLPVFAALLALPLLLAGQASTSSAKQTNSKKQNAKKEDAAVKEIFRTSDRCVACHNGLKTRSGEDISIGFQWRASIMANSSRDPYWQGSVRRESFDHPESQSAIEDECSVCHMPLVHLAAKAEGRESEIFAHLPLPPPKEGISAAADGVSCSVCHQVEKDGLGTSATFNGNVVIANPKNASLTSGTVKKK